MVTAALTALGVVLAGLAGAHLGSVLTEKFARLMVRRSGQYGPQLRELRDARRTLERVTRGKTSEDSEYRKANQRVIEAEEHVPWWAR